MCDDCRKEQTDDCRHCFVCGGIGQIARRCPSSDSKRQSAEKVRHFSVKAKAPLIFVHIVEKKAQNQT